MNVDDGDAGSCRACLEIDALFQLKPLDVASNVLPNQRRRPRQALPHRRLGFSEGNAVVCQHICRQSARWERV